MSPSSAKATGDHAVHGADFSSQSPARKRTVASRVRGAANVLTLLGAIVVTIGWAAHWPAPVLGRVALAAVTAFIISFVAILVENRQEEKREEES